MKAENQQIYRLEKYLKRGETINDQGEKVVVKEGNKIHPDSIKNILPFYDDATANALIKQLGTGKYGMVSKKGMPVQTIAEMFGYEDPINMINALVDFRTNKKLLLKKNRSTHG